MAPTAGPAVLAKGIDKYLRPTQFDPLPDAAAQALDALLTRRRQLVEMLVAERNRLVVAAAPVRRDLQQHIPRLSAAFAG